MTDVFHQFDDLRESTLVPASEDTMEVVHGVIAVLGNRPDQPPHFDEAARIIQSYGDQREAAASCDCSWKDGEAAGFRRGVEAAAKSKAGSDVLAERQRQIEEEHWSPLHDDKHSTGELAGAAACYALTGVQHWAAPLVMKQLWPWEERWWKPVNTRRDLVRAGALILAEIERLDRLAAYRTEQQP